MGYRTMRGLFPFILLSLIFHIFIMVIFGGLLTKVSVPHPLRFSYLKVTLTAPFGEKGRLPGDPSQKNGSSEEPGKNTGKTLKPPDTTMARHAPKNTHFHSPPTHLGSAEKADITASRKPLPERHHRSVDTQRVPESGTTDSGASSSEVPAGSREISGGNVRGTEGNRTDSASGGAGGGGDVDSSRLALFADEIRRRIEHNQSYPLWARKNNIEGIVIVHFILTRKGLIQDLNLEQSSGSAILDEAAKEAVLRGAPYPAFPDWLPHNRLALTQPIRFFLGSLP